MDFLSCGSVMGPRDGSMCPHAGESMDPSEITPAMDLENV